MGLSSLLFGGLTLLQARNNNSGTDADAMDPSKPTTVREILLQGLMLVLGRLQQYFANAFEALAAVDPQTLISAALVLSTIFIAAHTLRPDDASFRSYLTDLQLHEHLRKNPLPGSDGIQRPTGPATDAKSTPTKRLHGQAAESRPSASASKGQKPDWAINEQPNPHALTFVNRIAVSLRTPPYVRHDYAFFTLMMVKHAAEPCLPLPQTAPRDSAAQSSSSCKQCGIQDRSYHRPRASWYIGVFGRWFAGHQNVPDLTRQGTQRRDVSRRGSTEAELVHGVLDMTAEPALTGQRQSGKVDHAADGLAPDEVSGGSVSNSKSAKRKKNQTRLRPSQIPAVASRNALANSQKKNLDDGSRPRGSSSQGHDGPSSQSPPSPGTSEPSHGASHQAQQKQCQADVAAQAASLAAIEAVIKDSEGQIASLKSSTDSSQEQLQAQLDELRQRKRDEDAARADLKGRTKGLDEGKRQAEASRREAEKRLKAAQTAREAAEAQISASKEAMQSFIDREKASREQLEKSLQEGKDRREDMTRQQREDELASEDVSEKLAEVQHHIERLEKQLADEQASLASAQQDMQERIALRQQHANGPAPLGHGGFLPDSQHGTIPIGHEPYANGDHWQGAYAEGEHFYHEPSYAGSRRASEDQGAAMMYNTGSGPPLYAYPSQQQQQGHLPPFAHSNNSALGAPSGAAHLHTPRQPRSLHDISSAYTSNRRKSSVPPTSPFSMDLLPSNLFQTMDDDAQPGTLPGHRSETIEAALNKFGLDTSDQSDMEGNQSDRDTVDSVLDAQLGPLSEHGSEDEASGPKVRRNWWGSKSRQASKDRPTGEALSTSVGSEGDTSEGNGKRRSFGVWPRLSLNQLNAGAKSFRGSTRKQADVEALRGQHPEGYGSQGYLGPANRSQEWGVDEDDDGGESANAARSGSRVIPTQFDAVRRAFEASNPPNEEEGRRSWSAFDQWSQRQGYMNQGMRFNEGNSSSGAVNTAGLSRLGQESFNGWPEDVFQPLSQQRSSDSSSNYHHARPQAIAQQPQTDEGVAAPSNPGPASVGNRTNRSRFAFWSQNSKTSVNSATSGNSGASADAVNAGGTAGMESTSPPATGASDEAIMAKNPSEANNTATTSAVALGSSPASTSGASHASTSNSAKPSKRSFPWTRRRESTNSSSASAGAGATGVNHHNGAPSISSVQESDNDGDDNGNGNVDGDDGAYPPTGSPASEEHDRDASVVVEADVKHHSDERGPASD